MTVIGIDPGSIMTGIAVNKRGEFCFWCESDDPIVAMEIIEANRKKSSRQLHVVLEDFLGSGQLNKHKRRTIEVVGYVYHSCRSLGISIERVPQQYRLSNVDNVPEYIRGKDERAAAAHVLSYLERKATPCRRTVSRRTSNSARPTS